VCANCHRLDRVGHAVGPDLFGVRNQPKASLLLHILVPDHEITEGFAAYSVVTTEGRVLSGLVTGSTPEQVTLRLPQGVEQTLPRASLQEFSAAGVSLMPTGLERDLTQTQMADLLSFLKGERAPE
jgi:putative heme-binding domain-containing protein